MNNIGGNIVQHPSCQVYAGMKLVFVVLIIILNLCFCGCALHHECYKDGYKISDYFVDRGQDALDIFTLTGGVGGGGKARVGPLNFGFFLNGDCGGLRGGMFDWGWHNGEFLFPLSAQGGDMIGESIPSRTCLDKVYLSKNESFFCYSNFHTQGDTHEIDKIPVSAYAQIEIAAGLGLTVRIGFNPLEALDFVLGFATIDLVNDDCGSYKPPLQKREDQRINDEGPRRQER